MDVTAAIEFASGLSLLQGFGLSTALLFVIGLLLWIVAWVKVAHIPGPPPLPVIGNLYDQKLVISVMTWLKSKAKHYGKAFVFWPGGWTPMVVVLDALAVRQVLTSQAFEKGADYKAKFSLVFGEGLVTSSGERHKKDRACLGRFFVKSSLLGEEKLRKMNHHAKTVMREVLDPAAAGKSPPERCVDIQNFFHVNALRIFGEISMNFDFSRPENLTFGKHLNYAVTWGSYVVGEHIVLGIPMSPLIPRIRKLKRCVEEADFHMAKVINTRIEALDAAKKAEGEVEAEAEADEGDQKAPSDACPDDMLTAMIRGGLSVEQILDQMRTLLSAGQDTTAFTGCYMTYLLALHQDVQDKVKAEVREVLGSREEVLPEDVDKLTYCRMVMQETLRMYTVIPFVNRVTNKDVTLDNTKVRVPKGTTVLIPLSLLNRDTDKWEDASKFRPERFKDMRSHSSPSNGYLPFGYGNRTCIGATLAHIESTVILALLMQRYRFLPEPGFKPRIRGGISLVSQNGIKLRVEKEEL